ncbi:MAG TPA: hypothetical protein PKV91_03785 [Bacillota bacterium]|jgi:uncharacterized membrane protein YvbJ|nr:hypothetical protein [Bacillota bacterium]HOA36071.1 hypothetical protein [Bacillota bacterium]HOJ84054.1 hypothetical protein [Bacillota bacterium]HOL16185.1 hypothetical protein [Bacillota bacterium]HPZ11458.1 hypothetical protein [Bacillota bacterium]
MKKMLPAPAGLILFLILIICGCSILERGPQSSPEKLMETYLEAFKNDDFETMIRLSDELGVSEDELAFLKNFIQIIELESYSIKQVEYISDSEAAVSISLVLQLMGYEKRLEDRIMVLQKEGKWYIQDRVFDYQ